MHIPSSRLTILVALVFLIGSPNAGAAGYFEQREDGWFWYETRPESAEKPEHDTRPAAGVVGAPPLSAQWLKDNIPVYQMRALDDPTPQNVELYLYLQRLAMDRAEVFSNVAQQVTSGNPALDETIRNPVTSMARDELARHASAARDALLGRLAERLGLMYAFRSDCQFCHRQNNVLQTLQRLHGFAILPISLDGQPFADGSFPNWVPDQGQGAQLDISATPTLLLVQPPSTIVPLAVGLRTLNELEERILERAEEQGWITRAELDEATRGAPAQYLTEQLLTPKDDSPEAMLEALRSAAVQGGATAWGANISQGVVK